MVPFGAKNRIPENVLSVDESENLNEAVIQEGVNLFIILQKRLGERVERSIHVSKLRLGNK
jgi:hypothetical protein